MLEADVEVDRRDFTVRAAFNVAPGERLALFGPSGAGKTTVLETIAGLVPPRRGRVTLAGRVLTSTGRPAVAVPPWRRRVGLLRQDPGLFPHLSVRENLRYAPSARPAAAELAEMAGLLGIGDLLGAMPARLSGGQAHRVALGRLLLAHCDALLLDEPYTGLDASLRRALTGLVMTLVAAREVAAVLVTHELADAQAFAGRLAVLDRGRLLQVGGPDQVVRWPASRRVAELVGYLGFLPAEAVSGGGAGAGRMPSGWPGGSVLGVHPERILAGSHPGRGAVLTSVITAVRPAGAGWEADLRAAGAAFTARLPDRPGGPGRPGGTGGELVLTVLDPPCFGPDGEALRSSGQPEPSGSGR